MGSFGVCVTGDFNLILTLDDRLAQRRNLIRIEPASADADGYVVRLRMTDVAVVLCAGRATRLRPLTDECPKALLEVGGETILDRSVRLLVFKLTCGNVLSAL